MTGCSGMNDDPAGAHHSGSLLNSHTVSQPVAFFSKCGGLCAFLPIGHHVQARAWVAVRQGGASQLLQDPTDHDLILLPLGLDPVCSRGRNRQVERSLEL